MESIPRHAASCPVSCSAVHPEQVIEFFPVTYFISQLTESQVFTRRAPDATVILMYCQYIEQDQTRLKHAELHRSAVAQYKRFSVSLFPPRQGWGPRCRYPGSEQRIPGPEQSSIPGNVVPGSPATSPGARGCRARLRDNRLLFFLAVRQLYQIIKGRWRVRETPWARQLVANKRFSVLPHTNSRPHMQKIQVFFPGQSDW